MKIKKSIIIEHTTLTVYFIMILFGKIKFSLLPQVVDIMQSVTAGNRFDIILNLFTSLHPHAFRSLLMLPFYLLQDYLLFDINISFGIFVVVLMYYTYKYTIFISNINGKTRFLSFIFIFLLILAMNGRIAFAIYGNALLLKTLYQLYYLKNINHINFSIKILCGLLFTTVSTGAIFVGILSLVIFCFLILSNSFSKTSLKTLLSVFFVVFILIFYTQNVLEMYINKNLLYFDNSIINMLSHGVGKYLRIEMILFIPVLFIFVYLIKKKSQRNDLILLPLSMVTSASFIGLFGFSSLVSGLSGFILFIILYVQKNNTKQLYS